jgi:hypothetical protein
MAYSVCLLSGHSVTVPSENGSKAGEARQQFIKTLSLLGYNFPLSRRQEVLIIKQAKLVKNLNLLQVCVL